MTVNFNLYDGKPKKLEGKINELNRRLSRLERGVLDTRFGLMDVLKKINDKDSSVLGISERAVILASDKLDSILDKHSENINKIKDSVLSEMLKIEKDLNNFLNSEFSADRFSVEIAIIKKINHQGSNLSKLLQKEIINVNNEIVRINNLLTEIHQLTTEVVDDYYIARLDTLTAMKKEVIRPDNAQLLSEKIASLSPRQDSLGKLREQFNINQDRISLCSCGGIGRTGFC